MVRVVILEFGVLILADIFKNFFASLLSQRINVIFLDFFVSTEMY